MSRDLYSFTHITMIHIERNYLTVKECEKLISYYESNKEKQFKYRDTFPLCLYHKEDFPDSEQVKEIYQKIVDFVKELNPVAQLDMCQIVKWPLGSKMDPHKDAHTNDILAGVVNLNSDYEGGRTCIGGEVVEPEIGTLSVFSNTELLHWVDRIKKGERYTLALWFIGTI